MNTIAEEMIRAGEEARALYKDKKIKIEEMLKLIEKAKHKYLVQVRRRKQHI